MLVRRAKLARPWSPAQGEIDVTCNAVSYSERGWPVQANPVGRRSSAVASPEVEVQLSFTKASVRLHCSEVLKRMPDASWCVSCGSCQSETRGLR